jgi:hypothetical protein
MGRIYVGKRGREEEQGPLFGKSRNRYYRRSTKRYVGLMTAPSDHATGYFSRHKKERQSEQQQQQLNNMRLLLSICEITLCAVSSWASTNGGGNISSNNVQGMLSALSDEDYGCLSRNINRISICINTGVW